MKLRKAILAFAITGLAALPAAADEAPATTAQAATAGADASKEAPKTLDERVGDLEKSLGALANFELSGMFYTSYLWNFNDPDNRINSLRSLDNQDNTFGVDLFQLGIKKNGPGGLSAFIKLDVGNTASRIGADWNGNGQFTGVTGDSGDFEIEEVYANYAPDWSHGLSAKFGKFVTLLGAEVIEAPLNMNYSRSFLFGFAIPFTNTGVMFNYPFTDTLQTNLGVVNGILNVEAVRIAQEKFGKQPLTGEQVRWGFEHLDLSADRIKQLGFEGMIGPIKVSCMDHEGTRLSRVHQWDGKQWKVISDWYTGDDSILTPLVKDVAGKYAAEKKLTPRDCSKES